VARSTAGVAARGRLIRRTPCSAIVIVGGLTFFQALALSPLVEHLAMTAGTLFSAN
jgi:K+-transporting ATPase ATPase A chain